MDCWENVLVGAFKTLGKKRRKENNLFSEESPRRKRKRAKEVILLEGIIKGNNVMNDFQFFSSLQLPPFFIFIYIFSLSFSSLSCRCFWFWVSHLQTRVSLSTLKALFFLFPSNYFFQCFVLIANRSTIIPSSTFCKVIIRLEIVM